MIISNRLLCNYERISWLLDQTRNLHFVMAAEVTGTATAAQWRNALDIVQKRHPLLLSGISSDDVLAPAFYSTAEASIPLRMIPPGKFNLEKELEWELTEPFQSTQVPLARAALMLDDKRAVFILATHHAIADGISHAFIFRDLLTVLSGGELYTTLPVPSSLEHYLGLKPDTIAETISKKLPDVQPDGDPKKPVRAPKVHCVQWSAELTASVVARAKQEGTTVHGALCAAVVFAARQLSASLKERTIKVLTPVNLRNALDIREDCGYYINPKIVAFQEDHTDAFWETARFAKHNLTQVTDRESLLTEMKGLAAAFESLNVTTAGALGDMAFQYDFILTNIGVVPYDPNFGCLGLAAVWGPLMLNAVAGENNIGVATVNGKLHLTHISREPLAGLLSLMGDLLVAACREEAA